MKIDFINNTYIVYLNRYNIIDMDFSNTKALERDLKNLLLRLKKYYKIEIKGYYNITVYMDKYYGAVLKIEENNDYYDYFDDSIEVRMKKVKSKFLYEIDDISYIETYIDKFKISIDNNKVYLTIDNELNEYEYLKLLEVSNIIYDG